jgi:ribosomal protein S18 acetylase RimI-like enzyme
VTGRGRDTRVVLIGVDAAARGTGVADALLMAFAERSREWGATAADLVVEAGNPAAFRAYERNGWVPGETEHDTIRYHLDLCPDR